MFSVDDTLHNMKVNIMSNVAHFRGRDNITQEALAQAVGVTRQTIISIERGKYTPSVLLALRIAKHFDCAVEDIFTISYEK